MKYINNKIIALALIITAAISCTDDYKCQHV